MKNVSRLFIAMAGALALSTAFAQSSSQDQQQQPAAQNLSAGAADSGSGGVMQGAADAGSRDPVTRQEVKHELVQAEQDGQMKSLDHTIYKGN